jgi:hypothetical protein
MIQRIGRLTETDDWLQCGFCTKKYQLGYIIYLQGDLPTVCVCDKCLSKSKKSKSSWLKHNNDSTGEEPLDQSEQYLEF